MWCWWDSTKKACNEPSTGSEGGTVTGSFVAPGCWIFDLNSTSCWNTTGCYYDNGNRTCLVNASLTGGANIDNKGLNCTLLNFSSLCDSVAFLPYCCSWQGSNCAENKYSTSCKDSLKEPPEGGAFCNDYNAYTSESTCTQIANYPWYMPCRWNNATKHCEFRSAQLFTQGEEGDIDLIDNRDICEKGAGGQWLTESYCGRGNMSNASISAGRCAPKVGALGGNCDTACFKCEFKPDGANHTSENSVREACENSELGFCVWKSDTKAPNGYGYCEPSTEIKGGGVAKCDSNNCDACNFYNAVNAKTKCQEAKCNWNVDPLDPTKGLCASPGKATCLKKCENCFEQKTCVEKGRGVNGSCTWDATLSFCKKSTTSDTTGAGELCFDGLDNDGDGKTDCADGGCFTDPFCGGSFIKDCFQYSNNATCVTNDCKWFNDTYGGWCDQPAAICWQYDGDQAGCGLQNASCDWHASTFGAGLCNMNESVWDECSALSQSNCNTNSRCYWFIDPYMSGIGSSKGWCGHRHEVCYFNETLRSSQSKCENASTLIGGNISCAWRFDPWSPNSGFCESGCFTLGASCSTNGMCKSHDGLCDPKGFGGNLSQATNCFQFGTQSQCSNQTSCKWFSDPKASCDVSYVTDCFNFKGQTQCNGNINCTWIGGTVGGWCDNQENICRFNATQTKCESDPICFWKEWGGGYSSCEPKVINQTTETACTSLNGTWRSGWCESSSTTTMFTGMDMESPPTPLGNDPCPDTGVPAFSDICYFGMKDSQDNFGLGTGVNNIRDAAMCNGISTWQGIGSGNNTAKFYWYIDSDGKTSGGCALYSNSSSNGWDLHFRYESSYINGSVKEVHKSERCIDGSWKVSNMKISSWRQKMCNEIQGGMVSVNKDDLSDISGLLNLSATLRFYAATANSTANESNPSDTVGPSFFTPGSIDFIPECCWATGDSAIDCDNDGLAPANDPDCSSMLNKGFIVSEDCFGNSKDEDADGLTDCNDYDCKGNPYCVENKLGVEAAGYVDNIAPKIIYWNIEKYPDAVLLTFDTDEPSNGSLNLYYNSSSCVNLNTTLYDVGIWNNNTQKYKGWHEIEIYNDTGINSLNNTLEGNKTYFYKLKVCDKSGNCAQSACSNLTTAVSAAKCKKCSFIFDMDVPAGWVVDLDLDNNHTYETALHNQCGTTAGILVNYTTARHVNLRLRDNSTSNTTLFFHDIRLTRSISHNEKIRDISGTAGIKNGTTTTTAGTTVGYTGLSKEVSNKLVDKLHPKSCMIQIPKGTGSCNLLYHCDDNLKNCVRRDTEAGVKLNETGTNYCIWKIPCIFSTYAGGAPGSSSSSSSSSGGGGGGSSGGGGGAAAQATGEVISKSQFWQAIAADAPVSMSIDKTEIPVTKITFTPNKALSNVELTVAVLTEAPATAAPLSVPVYKYLNVEKKVLSDKDVGQAEFEFRVEKAWVLEKGFAEDDIVLMRYTTQWDELETAKQGSDETYVNYKATAPGFSYFAVGVKSSAVKEKAAEEAQAPQEVKALEEAKPQEQEEMPKEEGKLQGKFPVESIITALVVILGVVLFVAYRKNKSKY